MNQIVAVLRHCCIMPSTPSTRRQLDGVQWSLTSSLHTQAPWMVRQVDEDAVAAARAMRGYEKRRERIALEEKQGTINILDAASSELTGLGLKAKVLSEDEVELTWSTDDEEANRGFLVERKAVPTSA